MRQCSSHWLLFVPMGAFMLGCATMGGAGPGIPMEPPEPPSQKIVEMYQQATKISRTSPEKALRMYDQILKEKPDHFETLVRYAWILATSPDEKLRDPKRAYDMALTANDSIARDGLLRRDRNSFPPLLTPSRVLVLMSAAAAALAGQGRFEPTPEGIKEAVTSQGLVGADATLSRAAGSCQHGSTAVDVQAFVLQGAREVDKQFATPSTSDMVKRSEALMARYQKGEAPIGAELIADIDSQSMNLR
jgi:hypothetical protein